MISTDDGADLMQFKLETAQLLRWGAVAIAAQWVGHVVMVLLHAVIGEPLWAMFDLLRAKSGERIQ